MASPVIHPKYFLTDDDKRGILVVNGATAFSFVWTAFLTRLFQRMRLREWKPEDWLLVAALLLDTVHTGIVIHLIDLGLGLPPQRIPADQLRRLSEGIFAAQVIYIFTLFTSKCSVLCLYIRLSPKSFTGILSWIIIAVCTFWMVISIILISVPCNVIQAFTNPDGCNNLWQKWQAIAAIDIATEVLIFLIAVQLLWGLQLRFRTKFNAVLAFAARLPVIPAAAIRLYYLQKRITGQSYTSEYMIATQWQMGITIMASVVTGLGPFLRPFAREYTATSYATYGLSKKSVKECISTGSNKHLQFNHSAHSQSFLMQNLSARDERATRSQLSRHDAEAWADASATSRRDVTPDPASDGSLLMGISKTTDFSVQRDRASKFDASTL